MTTNLNASAHRHTRFELRSLIQGPNSFALECSERGVLGTKPKPLDVPEKRWTDAEMKTIHEALRLLEVGYQAEYEEEYESTPQEAQAATVQVADAEEALKALAEAHAKVQNDLLLKQNVAIQLDDEVERKRAAAKELQASIETLRAHHDLAEAALSLRKMELAAAKSANDAKPEP